MKLTKEQFERRYASRSCVTVQWLHEQGQGAVECDCKEKDCPGWKMVAENVTP